MRKSHVAVLAVLGHLPLLVLEWLVLDAIVAPRSISVSARLAVYLAYFVVDFLYFTITLLTLRHERQAGLPSKHASYYGWLAGLFFAASLVGSVRMGVQYGIHGTALDRASGSLFVAQYLALNNISATTLFLLVLTFMFAASRLRIDTRPAAEMEL